MDSNSYEKIIEVPRFDVPWLWEARNRRSNLIAKGLDPDQIVRVRMTSEYSGEIIDCLPFRLVDGKQVPIVAVS